MAVIRTVENNGKMMTRKFLKCAGWVLSVMVHLR